MICYKIIKQNIAQSLATISINQQTISNAIAALHKSKPEIPKLQPADQIRPAKPFHPANHAILSIMKNNRFMKNLLIW